MSAHTCRELTPGCYRCELHADEVNAWIDTLVVTRKQVVHDPDCSFVGGVTSTATSWAKNLPGDRACTRCLPDGLPE